MLNSTSLPVLQAELDRLLAQRTAALSDSGSSYASLKRLRAATRLANSLVPLIEEIQAKILLIKAGYTLTK